MCIIIFLIIHSILVYLNCTVCTRTSTIQYTVYVRVLVLYMYDSSVLSLLQA